MVIKSIQLIQHDNYSQVISGFKNIFRHDNYSQVIIGVLKISLSIKNTNQVHYMHSLAPSFQRFWFGEWKLYISHSGTRVETQS